MKLAFITTLVASSLFAQTPIDNGNFENWEAVTSQIPPFSPLYEKPSGTWWTTLNALKKVTLPVTATKTTDAQNGSSAILLTTKGYSVPGGGSAIIPGLLMTGTFDVSLTGTRTQVDAIPFTNKPTALKGYYKSNPVNGDSCIIYTRLFRSVGGQRVTVSEASKVIYNTVSTYTAFNLPYTYSNTDTPDSLSIIFVSSGAGQDFQGQPESQFWIDNVSLDYSTVVSVGELDPRVDIYPSLTSDYIYIHIPEQEAYQVTVRNLTGALVSQTQVQQSTSLNLSTYTAGVYFIELKTSKGSVVKKVVKH